MRVLFAFVLLMLQSLPLFAQTTHTFQQDVDGYSGAISVRFEYGIRQQTVEDRTHRYRYVDNNRIYNLEYFDLGDMSSWAEIAQARLIFYRQGGSIYTSSKIFVRRINDPDGIRFWKVANSNGHRNGANKESRDDTTNPDTKWQNSDPDSPEDLNADYFQYRLEDTSNSPYFIPQKSDMVGQAYELDVTRDVEAFRTSALPNQGWATWHANEASNINHWIANSNISKSSLRLKLVNVYESPSHIEKDDVIRPKSYELYQNYPNPFNSVTTIKYDIITSGNVELVICNVLGQEVVTLIRENQQAGSHSIIYNAAKLPSGVYYYSLRINNFIKIRKMILLK